MINWKHIQRKRGIHERRYNRKFRTALNKLSAPIFELIKNNDFTSPEDVDMGFELILLDGNIIKSVYDAMYVDVGLTWIDNVDKLIQKNLFTENDWNKLLLSAVEGEVAERIVSIVNTSRNRAKKLIKKEVAEGIERGEAIRDINKRINRVVPVGIRKKNKFRALTIALTEVGTVQSQASFIGAKQFGTDVIKIWNTAPYGFAKEERHNKMNMNGQERRMDEMFDVGGELMRFPGDPRGSAANTINCNCVMTYKAAV